MSFYEKVLEQEDFNLNAYWDSVTDEMVQRTIHKEVLSAKDYLTLLAPAGERHLEEMAQRAHKITLQHFGKVIFLYTPMYLSNYCVNRCAYCGYNVENKLQRKTLSLEEVEKEAKAIADTGLKHILILTGESKVHAKVDYLVDCVNILKKYFTSISIEIYPMDQHEYQALVDAGVDGITIYQETYDRDIYDEVHIAGPKKNYRYRIEAAERAGDANMRTLNVGALLGLAEWRRDAYLTGLHAKYLQDKYPGAEIGISLPRMRPHAGDFQPKSIVSDKNLVQILLATRLFLPRVGVAVSTRERAEFRNHLIKLGATKMSAGVSTEVGGHSVEDAGTEQFEISDPRTVEEMREVILSKGYQPVFKDWQAI